MGVKGGTGASTICHNVAWALSEQLANDVVIGDLDIAFGTAGLDFNQDPDQGIADALASPERLDQMLLDRLLTKCSERLSLFAAPATLTREAELTPQACESVIDVVRQGVPYFALDLPHIWSPWMKQVLIASDEVVLVAEPDLPNLRNAKNVIDLLKKSRSNDNPPLLVLNMVGKPKRQEISVAEFCQNVGVQPTSVIEYDGESFSLASINGQMVEIANKKAKAATQFRDLALRLANRPRMAPKTTKPSPLAPILQKLGLKK
jgi:pilus assembly protein CpaE